MPNPKAVIDIVANAGPFGSAISSVKRTLVSLRETMERVSSAAKYFLGAEVAAIAGFIKLEADQARAVAAVEAALRAQGKAVGEWSKRLQDAASAMQAVTTHGDETILQLMQLGMSLGISADQIEAVTKGALGLADMFGIGAAEAVKKLAQAMNGNYDALAELIPALKTATNNAEKLAIINKALGDCWNYSQAMAQTATGQFQQLKNMLGDLGENIGRAVMPAVTSMLATVKELLGPILEWTAANQELVAKIVLVGVGATAFLAVLGPLTAAIATATAAFATMGAVVAAVVSPIGLAVAALGAIGAAVAYTALEGDTFGEKMSSLGGLLASTWEWVKGAVADSLAFIGAAFENWSDTLRAAILQVALNYTSAFEDLKHWLTEALPEYLAWFGRNWGAIFADIGNFVATVTGNMYDNLVEFFANVWNWLAGNETDWRWKGLSDGFEATLREDLPEIAARELSATEQWLSDEIAKSMQGVWESYEKKREEWRRRMGLGPATEGESKSGGEPTAPKGPKPPTITPAPNAPESKVAKAAGPAFEDFAAAYARVANAAAAIEGDDAKRTADGVDALKKLNEDQTRRIDAQTERLELKLSELVNIAKQGAVGRFAR